MVSDTLDCGCDGVWITKIFRRCNVEAVAEGVPAGYPGGNIHVSNVVCADVLEVHEQCSKAVSVCSNEHVLACEKLWRNAVEPVGQHPGNDIAKALSTWKYVRRKMLVSLIIYRVFRACCINSRWRRVKTSSPDMCLFCPVLFGGGDFVETLQCPVVPLV